jgi:hypothetical protein
MQWYRIVTRLGRRFIVLASSPVSAGYKVAWQLEDDDRIARLWILPGGYWSKRCDEIVVQ